MKKLILLMLLLPTLLKAQTVVVLDVNQSPELNFEITKQDTLIVKGDSVKIGSTINVYGGSGELSYHWTPAESLSDSSVLSPVAFPSDTTKYLLTVTDSNGCSFSLNYIVNVKENVTQINNFLNNSLATRLYPNPNDGRFSIELYGSYKGEIEFFIVDNWGRTVHQKKVKNFNGKHIEKIAKRFPTGNYNLLVLFQNQKLQKQFIIQ